MLQENKKIKCKKCGQEMKKSGPYLHNRGENESVYNGPDEVYYWCMNEKCENFYKNIKFSNKKR